MGFLSIFARGDSLPLFNAASASGNITLATAPGAIFRLKRFELNLASAITASADLTVTLDAGDGDAYDTVLYRRDLSVGSVIDLVVKFGEDYEFKADDEIDIAWTNSQGRTYGTRVVYEYL